MTSPEKIEGLRQVLSRDGAVKFKNGAVVETRDGQPIKVIHHLNGVEMKMTFKRDELAEAYEYAIEPPPPRRQPTGNPDKYGEDAPW